MFQLSFFAKIIFKIYSFTSLRDLLKSFPFTSTKYNPLGKLFTSKSNLVPDEFLKEVTSFPDAS